MSAYEQLLYPAVRKLERGRVSAWHVIGGLVGPLRLISKIWTCWHRHMSRPFTRDGETYRVCLRCGVQRRFDLDAWKTKGAYYREKSAMQTAGTQSPAVPARTKLRLIA